MFIKTDRDESILPDSSVGKAAHVGQVGQSHGAGTSLRTCSDVFPEGRDGHGDCDSLVEGLSLSPNSTFQSSNVQSVCSLTWASTEMNTTTWASFSEHFETMKKYCALSTKLQFR